MAYENVTVASMDLATAQADQVTTNRFRVNEGDTVPIFIVRTINDTRIGTPPVKVHFLDGPDGKTIVIPSPTIAGRESILDKIKAELVATGAYYAEPAPMRKFLDGKYSHDIQLLDMRDHIQTIHLYQQALASNDQVTAQQLMATLAAAMLKEPVKVWAASRTVYGNIVSGITTAKSQTGVFTDPTDPRSARLLWVEKKKDPGKPFATYHVTWNWAYQYELPEALICDATKVRNVDVIMQEKQNALAAWPDSRVKEMVSKMGIQASAAQPTALPYAPPQAALPPVPQTPSMAMPMQPQPQVINVVPTPNPQSIATPSVAAAPPPGATQSAAALACFGKTPNFTTPQCNNCPQKVACMAELQKELGKATAAAQAPAVTPPVAPAQQPAIVVQPTVVPAAPVTNAAPPDASTLVANALNAANNLGGN